MNKRILLASKSPRRYELMKMAGFEFQVDSKNVDETHPPGYNPENIPALLAQKKAKAFLNEISNDTVVIGADTIVILDGKIFEKPNDRLHAIEMLTELSGKMHEVVTGVCLLTRSKELVFSETTRVYFNPISRSEIEYYVDNFKPFDKAGSYACQEWIGAIAICKIEGDYFNVVGLPINRVYLELQKL
jgi:septum formation protein